MEKNCDQPANRQLSPSKSRKMQPSKQSLLERNVSTSGTQARNVEMFDAKELDVERNLISSATVFGKQLCYNWEEAKDSRRQYALFQLWHVVVMGITTVTTILAM